MKKIISLLVIFILISYIACENPLKTNITKVENIIKKAVNILVNETKDNHWDYPPYLGKFIIFSIFF